MYGFGLGLRAMRLRAMYALRLPDWRGSWEEVLRVNTEKDVNLLVISLCSADWAFGTFVKCCLRIGDLGVGGQSGDGSVV